MKNDLGARRGKSLREPRSLVWASWIVVLLAAHAATRKFIGLSSIKAHVLTVLTMPSTCYARETHMEKAAQKGSRSCGKTLLGDFFVVQVA